MNDDINFECKLVVAGDGQDKTAVAGKSGEYPELNGHECGSCAGLGVVHGRIGYVNSFRMCGKVWNSHSRMGSVFFLSAEDLTDFGIIWCYQWSRP